MNEHPEQRDDFEGWPRPSRDVLRELERPALSWFDPDAEADGASVGVAA
ncbi:MAG TPA: hypothetical protein VE088_02520 [Gaiellaceae bacterium]|jgi:hypothetical protein|nr:hypothetical protein [Gaiellaceae bacterium]